MLRCTEPGLPEGALAELELKGSPSLKASLVVAADGPRSPTRAMAGLRPSGWSYDQVLGLPPLSPLLPLSLALLWQPSVILPLDDVPPHKHIQLHNSQQ